MFTKRQFTTLLLGGSILFFIALAVCYTYFYYTGVKTPIAQEEVVQARETLSTSQDIKESVDTDMKIVPTTKMRLQMVDGNRKVITESEMDATLFLGVTEGMLKERMKDYEIVQFDAYEVILQKQMPEKTTPITYALVVQDGFLGILEQGPQQSFLSLQLPETYFTPQDLQLFVGSGMPITLNQKLELQQQPYYIEQILQNYNE
ncbi:MAG: hypothetical protein ACRCWY_14005 [Cellulosilyticaceae bacterium]